MSLRELQLAAFDWAIEKRKKELKQELDDHRNGTAEIKEAASKELNGLVSARDNLRRSHKCLPGGMMWKSLLSPPNGFIILPWNEKS